MAFCLQALQQYLDSGKALPFPDGILINSQTQPTFIGDLGCSLAPFYHLKDAYKFLSVTVLFTMSLFFCIFRENLHVQDFKYRVVDILQLSDSRPYDEASWGWRISCGSEHVWFFRRAHWPIVICPSYLGSSCKGLLRYCIYTLYEEDCSHSYGSVTLQ